MNTKEIIRKPIVAGTFYPGKVQALEETILNLLNSSTSERLTGEIYGLVSPHAGYIYSGKVAADAYKQLQGKSYDNVIVISPSHFDEFTGCSVFFGNYQTPLGVIPTNVELAEAITSFSPSIIESTKGHLREHALEVQLPFLQLVLDNFNLIPIAMGSQDYTTADELSMAINTALQESEFANQKTLIIGSSDLSHYFPVEKANQLDNIVLKDIERFDEKKLFNDINSNKCQACGSGPILAAMITSKKLGAVHSKIMSYGTSGDHSHDYTNVVGYLSSVFYSN